MWLLKTLLLTALVVGLLTVALQNSEPRVDVSIFGYDFLQVRLFIVMFGAALAGFVVGLLFSAYRELRLRMRLSSERRQRDLLDREVRDLRAAPIDGLDDDREQPPTLTS